MDISAAILIILGFLVLIVTGAAAVFGFLILKNTSGGEMEKRINENILRSVKMFNDTVAGNQESIGRMQSSKFREMDIVIKDMYDTMETKLERLAKDMNEMHSLASGVDELKRVLSNVKTRGILGEISLGAIFKEILAPEQYEMNIATVPNSKNVVEFAVKLPGGEDGCVYLPVDSKFPLDAYSALCAAREGGSREEEEAAKKQLASRLCAFAKDIHTKYIEPPYTTDFGIMFLPVESLYLEAVELGLTERLQREYKINIAGPSTFAAMLNSLQMGFRTLAVEKSSARVWKTLSDVRTEFDKFADTLAGVQQLLRKTDAELDKLVGVRTRAIQRKLRALENDEDM